MKKEQQFVCSFSFGFIEINGEFCSNMVEYFVS